MRVKRTKYDDLFSRLIRERDDYTCQRCGRQGQGASIHCSHFYSRRHQNTRYDCMNACAHCAGCHSYLGGNPRIFSVWVEEYLGKGAAEILDEKHRQIKKWTKADKEEMYRHYQSELKRIQELRSQGAEGVLEVVNYD